MRRFAFGSLLVLSLAVGCEKPVEGIPGPGGSGVSAGDDLAVEMPAADTPPAEEKPAADAPAAENAAPPADPAKPADPAAEAPKADEPKADAPKADEPKAEAPKAEEPKADAPKTEEPKQSSNATAGSVKFVSTNLKVPTMTCPHGCWPTVKQTLSAQPGVAAVELSKQAKEDAIDNPVVVVKLDGKFDAKAAIQALAKAGFENAEVLN